MLRKPDTTSAHRGLTELDGLRVFYDDVAAAGPAIKTPRILHVLSAEKVKAALPGYAGPSLESEAL